MRGIRASEARSLWQRPELAAPETIDVSSAAFNDGGRMPDSTAGIGVGLNRSPQLTWHGVPAGTAQLLLVIEDVDVPLPRPIVHTTALVSPDLTSLPEGGLAQTTMGVSFLATMLGRRGYAGPRPVPGHGAHRYGFQLYAIGDRVLAPEMHGEKSLLAAVSGRVLARGRLVGVYERT
jgi:hypothetical protein